MDCCQLDLDTIKPLRTHISECNKSVISIVFKHDIGLIIFM